SLDSLARHSRLEQALWVLLAAVAVHAIYYLCLGLTSPVLDLHNFRQAQTAISAYWSWREGFKLAYETPVLGYPWAIPFEFPIY
ncbi:MAG: glycosyl transferase, partial [bacterium]